ncbi:type II toxin-antitoxin system MqsR family toxin [Agrobacterium rosae]|uniref:type II toxin-antitoxin system MqsR family toxin n=1 Tax=Agrobacterium rosae TaxID=1972867 RepID=UPI00387AE6A3
MPVSEKRKPHYPLVAIFECIAEDRVRATRSSFDGTSLIGIYKLDEMCGVIRKLQGRDFYKSMTTYSDHTLWQDVYRPVLPSGIKA